MVASPVRQRSVHPAWPVAILCPISSATQTHQSAHIDSHVVRCSCTGIPPPSPRLCRRNCTSLARMICVCLFFFFCCFAFVDRHSLLSIRPPQFEPSWVCLLRMDGYGFQPPPPFCLLLREMLIGLQDFLWPCAPPHEGARADGTVLVRHSGANFHN